MYNLYKPNLQPKMLNFLQTTFSSFSQREIFQIARFSLYSEKSLKSTNMKTITYIIMITYVCKRIYLAYTYIKPLSRPKYLIQKYFRPGWKMSNFVNIITILNVANFHVTKRVKKMATFQSWHGLNANRQLDKMTFVF